MSTQVQSEKTPSEEAMKAAMLIGMIGPASTQDIALVIDHAFAEMAGKVEAGRKCAELISRHRGQNNGYEENCSTCMALKAARESGLLPKEL